MKVQYFSTIESAMLNDVSALNECTFIADYTSGKWHNFVLSADANGYDEMCILEEQVYSII